MDLNPQALYSLLRRDLASYVSDQDLDFLAKNDLWPDASLTEAACASILKSILKKLRIRNSKEQDRQAATKFMAINERCRKWELQLQNSREEALYGEFKRAIYEFFTPEGFDLVDNHLTVLDVSRCGPGASLEARGGDSYTKLFSSPLTCTDPTLYFWYKRHCSYFPSWDSAEKFRAAQFGDKSVVVGNRLSFVPKDDKVSRSICTEPSLNMYFQLGLGHMFERRLLSMFGLNMSTQPFKNRELARLGSQGWGYVTIDLSSASDSIALSMLESVVPRGIMNLVKLYRSPVSSVPEFGEQQLWMVSTMGNGFTFPLQTAIFACICKAAFTMNGVKPINPRGTHHGNWGVFGDDIIVPDSICHDVFKLLDILGFTVNPSKTFVKGPFRESCGGDYFHGRDIRGVYVKSLDTPQDRIAVINQLNLFSTRTGIQLPCTVQALVQSVPWLPVPPAENDVSGIKVPSSLVRNLPYCVSHQSILYTRYEAVGAKLRIYEDRIKVPRGARWRLYNPDGLYISFLQRCINSSTIGVRHDTVKYKRKRVSSPFWDYKPTIHPLWWFNWQRWETAVYLNLFG